MRTLVTFESSSFNTSEAKEYFINPTCFGEDVCLWLMWKLRANGVETEIEPGQEDFGWYFNFILPEGAHCCVVGYRPGDTADEGGLWMVWVETPWLPRLYSRRAQSRHHSVGSQRNPQGAERIAGDTQCTVA